MRRFPLALLAAVLVAGLVPPTASADTPVFTFSGSYKVGSALADFGQNACRMPNRATNGVDSSCVNLTASAGGLIYQLTWTDATGMATPRVCFYSGTTLLACNPLVAVPPGADRFSVTSQSGVNVQWTLRLY